MSDLDLPLAVRMMQDGYLMEIQDLKEKNEQLRKERDFYFQQVTENGERAHNAIDALNAENEKLRELVRDMYEDIVCGCAECFFSEYNEHRGKPSECDNGGCGYRQIADRMRDLGVDE